MNRHMLACSALALCLSVPQAQAYFEEGNDTRFVVGYQRCSTLGDLTKAETTGCNPWPDWDTSYSFEETQDIKKNSLHYNATAALAVAAGFNRCAAYLIGLYDEATDVATEFDSFMWTPFLPGVTEDDCAELFAANGVDVLQGVSQLGGLAEIDFTNRAFAPRQDNEIRRESNTFHWNHTISSVSDRATSTCSEAGTDPLPAPPNRDVLTLGDLLRWVEGENLLNQCPYTDEEGSHGPITHYNPSIDPAPPGSLAALGVFMHALQDSYSHRPCAGNTHSYHPTTANTCGMVSSHYAGEYGRLKNNLPGTGTVYIRTPASTRPYTISLHSDSSVDAIKHSFEMLRGYLQLHPEYGRGVDPCPQASIGRFATSFASIANFVPAEGSPSGAKLRSDLADSLFASDMCGDDVAMERFIPEVDISYAP